MGATAPWASVGSPPSWGKRLRQWISASDQHGSFRLTTQPYPFGAEVIEIFPTDPFPMGQDRNQSERNFLWKPRISHSRAPLKLF